MLQSISFRRIINVSAKKENDNPGYPKYRVPRRACLVIPETQTVKTYIWK